jgi:hypothetical protein
MGCFDPDFASERVKEVSSRLHHIQQRFESNFGCQIMTRVHLAVNPCFVGPKIKMSQTSTGQAWVDIALTAMNHPNGVHQFE